MIEDIRYVQLYSNKISFFGRGYFRCPAGFGMEYKINGKWKPIKRKKGSVKLDDFFKGPEYTL